MTCIRRLVAATLLFGMASGCASLHERHIRHEVERRYCVFPEDDVSGQLTIRRLEEVSAMGEPGRRALLSLARTPKTEGCGIYFLAMLGDARVTALLRQILVATGSSAERRSSAIAHLGGFHDTTSLDVVAPWCDSSDRMLSDACLQYLGLIDDVRARHQLMLLLEKPGHASVASVIDAIGRQRDVSAVPRLIAMSGTAPEGLQRRIAVALAEIGSSDAVNASERLVRAATGISRHNVITEIVSKLTAQLENPAADMTRIRADIDRFEKLRQP